MQFRRWGWPLLIAANVVFCCVLSLYRTGGAAPQAGRQPFRNSVDQREEMIRELKAIHALLKEQNALLRAGPRLDANERPVRQPDSR